MSTLAWIMILSAVFLLRAVSRGRVMELPTDLADGFLAIVNGKVDDLSEVLARKGDSTTPSGFDVAAANLGSIGPGLAGAVASMTDDAVKQAGGIQQDLNRNLAFIAVDLGHKAKGYRLTATGPDYYDCSGLVWRATQKVGYKGPRFTTSTILMMKGFHRIDGTVDIGKIGGSEATIGDIVLWPGHHMGIVYGPDQMYSARNPSKGIGVSSISGFRKDPPIYVRYTGK